MPELKQLSDFYDPTRAGMAALNVMQNQQHMAIQQQQADQQGRHAEVQNVKAALGSANPMESYPLYAKLMELNGQTPPGVNEYYANTNMYNKLVSATPGTPEHTDAMDKWSRTSEGSRKIVEGENNTARARAGSSTLLAQAGMPSDPSTSELMRQSGQMQAQVTDALAQSALQKEKTKAMEMANQEHERVSAYTNTQLSTLIPGAKAAELAIQRADPFVVKLDAINAGNRGLGEARAMQVSNERIQLDPELRDFEARRKENLPKIQQAVQQLEDQQSQLQTRAEMIAQGVEPMQHGESLEMIAGKIDASQHQMSYMRAQLQFTKNPTAENLNALRNVKASMDESITQLSNRKRISRESLDIQRGSLDEKIFMDRHKIERESSVGQAQADWLEAGGNVKDLPKIARKYNVKIDEIRDAAKDPNRPLSTSSVEVHMPKTTEEAGKFAMIDNATKSIDAVTKAITKPDGSIDRAKVFASAFNIPFTEGRNISSMMEDAISAKLRAETGAAANASEVESIKKRFDISTLDTDAVLKDKIARLRRFMDETRVIRDPSGKIREVAGQGQKGLEANAKANGPAPKGKLSPQEQSELDMLRKKYGR